MVIVNMKLDTKLILIFFPFLILALFVGLWIFDPGYTQIVVIPLPKNKTYAVFDFVFERTVWVSHLVLI